MSNHHLPARASLEYLKKLAKERLLDLRASAPAAKLADAQLAVAREHGFASWRALKAEIDRRRAPAVAAFFQACATGEVPALRELLASDAGLVRERAADGSTGLHRAVRHADAVRLLIEHGADPNARDAGDNVSPLHVAAANRALESVRLLLDAGADVHGTGDLHKGDVIGWAASAGNDEVIALLIERGARHHIFSAMALGDLALVERLVDEHAECLLRRRSRFENSQTPVHAAFAPPDGIGWLSGKPDYAMLQLLVDLGADVEATDDRGRSPLAVAMLRGDREAIRILEAAGAKRPVVIAPAATSADLAAMANAVTKGVPSINVPDIGGTLDWYVSIGFTELARYEHDGVVNFGMVSFGSAEIAFGIGEARDPHEVSVWLYTDRVAELYQLFKQRQLGATAADLRFDEDLFTPFYGGRQFSIRDNNGVNLIFYQPDRS